MALAGREHAWLAEHPARVRYDGFAGNGVIVPDDSPIVVALAAAHLAATGVEPSRVVTTATTDARAFVECGIPAVCLGARAEAMHGVDERVHFPTVIETARTLGVLMRDWCGVTS